MQSVHITFYQKHKASDKEITINCRVTIEGKRLEISTGTKIEPKYFDTSKNIAKGKSSQATYVNQRIEQLRTKINRIVIRYDNEEKILTTELLKKELSGKKDQSQSLMYVFRMHNKGIARKIGKGYSDATLEKYNLTKTHVLGYLEKYHSQTDINLSELNYGFITGFEGYLLDDLNGSISSVNKHTQRLKKVVNHAILNEWIEKDPFIKHRPVKEESKEIIFLDDEELKALEEKEFEIDRLSRIRDFFVFCCYTGLAFKEVESATRDQITKDMDGDKQLVFKRQKTGKIVSVPLLPKALDILDKYQDDPIAEIKGKLLPIPSNVKFNAYLKEIADLCGIKKHLTVHTARKTFATTVLLLNDVPMETASELLGHYSVKMTQQLYGKIVAKKVKKDINRLKEKLANS